MAREYVVKIPRPHPQQQAFIDSMAKRQIVKAGRRGGKAQPLTAKIYTPTGPVLMGDIKIGDKVLTPFSGIAIVEDIFPQGVVDIYKVTFADKTIVECTLDHLWEIHEHNVERKWRDRQRVYPTSEILRLVLKADKYNCERPKIIPTEPVIFNEQEVPVDPYLLGLLIGDGSMSTESIGFTSIDEYLLDQVKKRLPAGMIIKKDRDTIDYVLRREKLIGVGRTNPLIQSLKKLGLFGSRSYEKFIPDIYKYNSINVRLEIIRGLLDTDGSVDDGGHARFEQTSERLANDFAEIIESLGGLVSTRVGIGGYKLPSGETKWTRNVYSQYLFYNNPIELFKLPRKRAKTSPRIKEIRKYIRKVEFSRKEEAQCIKISDPRGLYLTDHFTPTHNTVGNGIKAVDRFIDKFKRVLYAVPTSDQVARFWYTVTIALEDMINDGWLYKNETEHIIQLSDNAIKELISNPANSKDYINKIREARIRAKTAWNADTLRGDYADELILDEFQLMHEEAWTLVGSPMLLDNNGNVTFIYTPPSLEARTKSKAKDAQYAAKLFKRYSELQKIKPERYAAFHFTSMDNPYISKEALREISDDMTSVGYRMEILAEDVNEAPGALWTRDNIEKNRIFERPRDLDMVIVGVDPSASSTGDEAGIIVGAKVKTTGFILADDSIQGPPLVWAKAAVKAYHHWKANKIVAEANQGGEMVSTVIHQVDSNVPVELVHASRGKATRAEPVSVLYEKNSMHHVGYFPKLEDEMCLWVPGMESPNRMDAMVWCINGLKLVREGSIDWTKVVGGH